MTFLEDIDPAILMAITAIGVIVFGIVFLRREGAYGDAIKAIGEKIRRRGGFGTDPQFPNSETLYGEDGGLRMYYEPEITHYKSAWARGAAISGGRSYHKFTVVSGTRLLKAHFSKRPDTSLAANGEGATKIMKFLLEDQDGRFAANAQEVEFGPDSLFWGGKKLVMRIKAGEGSPLTWTQHCHAAQNNAEDAKYVEEMASFVGAGFGFMRRAAGVLQVK